MRLLFFIIYTFTIIPIGELVIVPDRETVLVPVEIRHRPNLADTVTVLSMKYIHDDMLIDQYTLKEFKDVIAIKETGYLDDYYRYKKVNRYGYMGKYQFHMRTVNSLAKQGYLPEKYYTKQEFINSPALQETTMNALIVHHLEIFRKWDLAEYVGVELDGGTITYEGLLAGAHLVGVVALRHYLENDLSLEPFMYKGRKTYKIDANGTTVEDYIKLFLLY